MKKLYVSAGALLLIGGLITACNKNTDPITPIDNGGVYASLDAVYSSLEVRGQKITMDAATGGSFRGTSGSRYTFQPNSFRTKSGGMVSGNVEIEVRELLKPSDMIFSKVLPVSNGQPLVSGGEVQVTIRQSGQELLLADGMTYSVQLPQFGANNTGMDLFLGAPKAEDPVNVVNWQQVRKDSTGGGQGGGIPIGGIVHNGDTITLFSDSVGWANADRFLTNPNYQTFTVNITGANITNSNQVTAYALYDTYNGVWPMMSISNSGVISENHVPDIPMHFVVIAIVNGRFYGGITSVTPANGNTYTVALAETDPNAFKIRIDGL